MFDSAVNDFAHVRLALLNGGADGERTGRPVFDRLLGALDRELSYRPRTGLDQAVLVRHVLRYETVHRNDAEIAPSLELGQLRSKIDAKVWSAVGVQLRQGKHGPVVTASPWEPKWLSPDNEAADYRVALEKYLRGDEHETSNPDPFLRILGKESYRSPGQRVAVRSAIIAPPGSTLLVTLPTGEGKSLVFESLGHFGTGSGPPGVTPVIVPTVALALDHQKSAQKMLNTDRPFAYIGGSSSRSTICEAIINGNQGLCFMAPESACGPLQKVLLEAARKGYIGTFVIDESHLVEAWGSDFRTSFPLLSALRARMLSETNPQFQIRTLLLSATLTQMAVDTLKSLFSEKDMGVVNGARLRPELHFFTAPFATEDIRRQRVLEAVAHLPRPLILYASKPDEVNEWHAILCQQGYGNLAKFHGGTSSEDRELILDAWRDGRLDMVVGNSAFGLGIDYPHVRTVIHACLPETLDRFYQEVGRGGRDGRASVSLLIPAYNDKSIAENLNRQKIITLELGRQRWRSMFEHGDRKTLKGRHRYGLRLNVSPSYEQDDLDKVGLRSVDWNDRILTVMARAGIIRILDRYSDKETDYPWAEVEILKDHDTEEAWENIGRLREAIHENNADNLKGIMQYARGTVCPAPLLSRIYTTNVFTEFEHIGQVCSGCPVCGNGGNNASYEAPTPCYPWGVSRSISPDLASSFDHNNLFVVEYQSSKLHTSQFQREIRETFQNLREYGFTNLLILGSDHEEIGDKALALDASRPFFVNRGRGWLNRSMLPPGPEIVFLLPAFVQVTPLQPAKERWERLVFIPNNMRDPTRPDRLFLDSYSGSNTHFESFRLMVLL
jgi:ATP-dependent DNA helicase RecQ